MFDNINANIYFYTGEPQKIRLTPGRYFIECNGGDGGDYFEEEPATMGLEGYSVSGEITIEKTQDVYMYIGEYGKRGKNGWPFPEKIINENTFGCGGITFMSTKKINSKEEYDKEIEKSIFISSNGGESCGESGISIKNTRIKDFSDYNRSKIIAGDFFLYGNEEKEILEVHYFRKASQTRMIRINDYSTTFLKYENNKSNLISSNLIERRIDIFHDNEKVQSLKLDLFQSYDSVNNNTSGNGIFINFNSVDSKKKITIKIYLKNKNNDIVCMSSKIQIYGVKYATCKILEDELNKTQKITKNEIKSKGKNVIILEKKEINRKKEIQINNLLNYKKEIELEKIKGRTVINYYSLYRGEYFERSIRRNRILNEEEINKIIKRIESGTINQDRVKNYSYYIKNGYIIIQKLIDKPNSNIYRDSLKNNSFDYSKIIEERYEK